MTLSPKHIMVRDCALRLQAETGERPLHKQIMAELGIKSWRQMDQIMKDLQEAGELKLTYIAPKAKAAHAP